MVDIKDKGCHKCIDIESSSWFRVGDRQVILVVVIAVIKFKQHSVEKQRRLSITPDGGEGEFGKARVC